MESSCSLLAKLTFQLQESTLTLVYTHICFLYECAVKFSA